MSENNLLPHPDETPAQYADRLAVHYAANATEEHKKELGQFFTPLAVAQFLASFGKVRKNKVRILDPGCGIGILSAALCEILVCETGSVVREIELVAFETDVSILPDAEKCFEFLAEWLENKNITFTYFLCKNDFVLHNSDVLNKKSNPEESYDLIISNPPYFKLAKGDRRISASRSIVYGQSNIYSIFMVIASRLLNEGGKLIFITPRSFCSGSYFRVFREVFFDIVDLETVHLFHSRSKAFKRDKVLQENVIVVARRKYIKPAGQMELTFGPFPERQIIVSASEGISDVGKSRSKSYGVSRLINMQSYQKILHLPTSDSDELILDQFRQWAGSLNTYDLKISTGPIVDFRSSDFIQFQPNEQTVPLLWLHNVFPMQIIWPNQEKGKPKGQYYLDNVKSLSRLLANRNYVLLRRFSSKDDKSRLVAAPYLRTSFGEFQKVGFENHINYIYHKERDLTDYEVYGIAALFNSVFFDLYFRTFNGNINVSATELSEFPLPSFELIRALGRRVLASLRKEEILDVDKLVAKIFNLKLALSKIQ